MNVSSLSAYPYISNIAGLLDSQTAAAQQSIDELRRISASYEVKISDYGMIQSGLSTLQSAAQKLSGTDAFSLYSAKSSDSGILTAYAQQNASAGAYRVEVSQLAQGETLVSAARPSLYSLIGSGAPSAVTFQFANGSSRSVTIDRSNNTLPGIAAGINQAGIGISASVAFTGSAFQLVLNGPSGSSNAFNIGVSGEDDVARLLSYSNGGANNAMTQTMAAQDSQGSINGTPFAGHSNVVAGAAEGITLNLGKTGSAAITVATDMDRITGAVQSFVDAYNRVQGDLSMHRAGEPPGDRTAIGNRLSDGLQPVMDAPYGSLEQIGITRNQDGTLTLDAGAFREAYSQNPAGVAHLFTGDGKGLADRISEHLQNVLQPGGSISSTIEQLLSKIRENQRMEDHIEDKSFRDLQHSAHQYAQQLAMMIVAQIVSQFMQGAPDNATQANRLYGTPGISGPEALLDSLAPLYNQSRPGTPPAIAP